ncbi:MAG: hypothetical protein ACXQTU_04320 [Candidatus Nezhaarchaeales archaeon]
MTCITEDVVEEILKAIKMAAELKSKGLNQAAIQSSLSRMAWKCAEPISVGDDYSLVFKIAGVRPCSKDEIEAQGISEIAEPIRNFPLVIKLDKGYIAIGSSALRTSLNVSREALIKIIQLCIKS